MADRRTQARRRLTVAIALALSSAAACSNDKAYEADANDRILASLDERFREHVHLRPDPAAPNFGFEINGSASYDADIDPQLLVVGFVVNDTAAWASGGARGWDEKSQQALAGVLADVGNHASHCAARPDLGDVTECAYPQPIDDLRVFVRSVAAEYPATLVVIATTPGADEFVTTKFEQLAATDVERWFAG